jgi:hypothetical protein
MTPLPHPGTATARGRRARLGVVVAVGALLASGCTADPAPPAKDRPASPGRPAGPALRLAAFSSCGDALTKLKRAAKEIVGPYGLGYEILAAEAGNQRAGGGIVPGPAVPDAARGAADAAQGAPGAGGAPAYSGTNNHEAGVDEPDLVKTDGRRIVTVSRGVLRVVDAQRRAVVGTLDLGSSEDDEIRWSGADLLLRGDRVLVLARGWGGYGRGRAMVDAPAPPGGPPSIFGPDVLLVDISGKPRLLSRHRMDGNLVDARQVGDTARLVLTSSPRLTFPMPRSRTDEDRIAENRRIIDRTPIDAWLPRYEVTEDGRTHTGRVPCDRLSHPTAYSGSTLLTVLTFDLSATGLGDGNPVTVVADGETVYGTGTSLYVATDQRWRSQFNPRLPIAAVDQSTEIFKFDTSGSGRPRFVAAGTVPGWLVNQYAMSEWDGRLRVATTVDDQAGRAVPEPGARRPAEPPRPPATSSGVYVLRADGDRLVEQGRVTGLGKGERIYGVRFVGPVGYVVTFRQTDPLYTVDLGEPARPRVAGELKITGYSAYLHPAGDGRLIGVGQEATTDGRRRGAQVSLFDVSNLDSPRRLAQHFVRSGHTEAEYDPHAFLYWPADRLLVMPMSVSGPTSNGKPVDWGGALVLRLGDREVTEVGTVRVPEDRLREDRSNVVQRSLVIGDVLWTLSDGGLQAVDVSTLGDLAWVTL